MDDTGFIPNKPVQLPDSGTVGWAAPSNIALVKYWGKYPVQIPANPSISFTLDASRTETFLSFTPKRAGDREIEFDVRFEGAPAPAFEPKIRTFFERILRYLPFLTERRWTIETRNTFPHSSGIASSASGMAALALDLCQLEAGVGSRPDLRKASFLARLGSGSACRSLYGGLVTWGAHPGLPGSSDEYGSPFSAEVHPVFRTYRDTILLVHEGAKSVSSTVGHGLMEGHPFAQARFAQARANLAELSAVLGSGDLESFVRLVEGEALTLHAMMLASTPSYILMRPATLSVIEAVRAYRETTGIPVCFTLDAGANVHLLYPDGNRREVDQFIADELVVYCERGNYICDSVGLGPVALQPA